MKKSTPRRHKRLLGFSFLLNLLKKTKQNKLKKKKERLGRKNRPTSQANLSGVFLPIKQANACFNAR